MFFLGGEGGAFFVRKITFENTSVFTVRKMQKCRGKHMGKGSKWGIGRRGKGNGKGKGDCPKREMKRWRCEESRSR